MNTPLRLLLVEDSEDDSVLLLESLRRAEFDVYHRRVETRESMQQALRDETWDLILSDYCMPAFDAPAAIQTLKESRLDVPLIVISGTVGEDVAVETLQLGAVDYLLKQNLIRLIPAVKRALKISEGERKQRSFEHMKTLFMENLLDMICTIDARGNFIEVSDASHAILGYPSGELTGRAFMDFVHPDDRAFTQSEAESIMQGRHTKDFENRYVHRSGKTVHLMWSAAWSESDGLMIAVARDVTERKRKDEALRLRERALGQVSQGVLITDETYSIIYVNPSFSTITGYGKAEALGHNCTFLQGPGTNPATVEKIRAYLRSGVPFEGEILNYRKDGTPFWNELSIAPIPDEKGGPLRFIGIQRDITRRKEEESALQESEERFRRERALLRGLIDNIPDLIFFKNKESIFLGCNKAFENRMKILEKDLVGRTDFDLLPQETAEFFRGRDLELFASGGPQRTEEWIPHPAGGGGHYETVKTPYRSPDGELLGLIAVSRDITERKQAQQALASALEHLKLAVKAGKAGTWSHDLTTDEVTWDEQMLAIYGKTPADVEPGVERWHEAIHPDDLTKAQAVYETAITTGQDSFELEFRICRRTDQAERVIRAIGSILRDESGQPVRMTGINWDVTEERIREQKLTAALIHEKDLAEKARAGERAKSEFLAVMSHEVRTPLNGILGFAELLAQGQSLTPEYQGYARTIVQSGESLLRILDDILDFSRLEAGRLEIESAPFRPRELLEDIRLLLARQAAEKDLQLLVFVDPVIPEYLDGDAGRLRQVLLNLTGNAIKFTEQGTILISLKPASDSKNFLVYSVKDTGTGIAPDQLERIFKPFIQADSSISRRHGGTGLGLAISRRLTELLGGTLVAQSQPGQGSEFFVTVPLRKPKNQALPQVDAEVALDATFASRHPLRILLVEDDSVNLKLIKTLIRRLGYDPLTAANGREAVDAYHKNHPDCLLMDLQMPEMDGIEATRQIRELEKSTGLAPPFIFALTANIFPADRQRCFDVGMDDYLNKPVKLSSLAQVLLKASSSRAES